MKDITSPPCNINGQLDRDEQASAFLRQVLPPEGPGLYCLFKKKTTSQTQHVSTIEELWYRTQEFERGGRGNVYFALATFKDNALELRCFFADIDVDEKKAAEKGCYATPKEAGAAIKKFCAVTGWPAPLVVGSGHGVHLYWPLTKALPAAEWKPLADKAKRLFRIHGLRADPSVTADPARVLRVPGTTNRKNPSAPIDVTLQRGGLDIGPYDLKLLLPALNSVGEPGVVIRPDFGPKPDHLKAVEGRTNWVTARAGMEPFPLSGAEMVAKGCAQIAYMRDERGAMPEPEWHHCIGVLARCEDGERFCHEWSEGDERYDRAETQKKIDRALRETTGPTKCETFAGLNARCEGCPHWGKISSPIELGRLPSDPAVAPLRAAIERDIAKVNEDYFLVPVGSKVVVGSFGKGASGALQLQQVDSFKLWFRNQYVQIQGDDGSVRKRPLGDYWLGHRDRRQYEGLDLLPAKPPELPNGKLNLWRGYGVDARPGDWSRMNSHIHDVLAAGHPKAAEYILRWAAWCVQHPGEVYATAALQQQKEESLSLTDGWWVELLQEGKLPGSGINGRQKDFAMTEDLVEDAMQKAPRLRGYFSKNGMGRFLRKRGCVAYQERSVGREGYAAGASLRSLRRAGSGSVNLAVGHGTGQTSATGPERRKVSICREGNGRDADAICAGGLIYSICSESVPT